MQDNDSLTKLSDIEMDMNKKYKVVKMNNKK